MEPQELVTVGMKAAIDARRQADLHGKKAGSNAKMIVRVRLVTLMIALAAIGCVTLSQPFRLLVNGMLALLILWQCVRDWSGQAVLHEKWRGMWRVGTTDLQYIVGRAKAGDQPTEAIEEQLTHVLRVHKTFLRAEQDEGGRAVLFPGKRDSTP